MFCNKYFKSFLPKIRIKLTKIFQIIFLHIKIKNKNINLKFKILEILNFQYLKVVSHCYIWPGHRDRSVQCIRQSDQSAVPLTLCSHAHVQVSHHNAKYYIIKELMMSQCAVTYHSCSHSSCHRIEAALEL
jgi:hypothetical protein